MRRTSLFSKTLLGAAVMMLALGTTSCKKEAETDPKEVAEDQNEVKFDENDAKEDDSEYLVFASSVDMKEIELGKLALQKSSNADVKSLAQMMIDAHTKASKDTKMLADTKNITLPTALSEDGQEALNKLNEKSGADFDKAYADKMVDGHKKAIDKIERASETANDADIRMWAANMLPELRKHLEHAEMAKGKVDAVK